MRKIIFYSIVLTIISSLSLLGFHYSESEFVNQNPSKSKTLWASSVTTNNTASLFSEDDGFSLFIWTALGFGIFGTAFGFINLGSKRIKMHNQYLESMVKDRTKILEKKHQELLAQNEDYKAALSLIKEQKEEIEAAQQDLLIKNKENREALEEIQSQNELLDLERNRVNEAKRIIQEQNRKLLNIARNLDQQVQERTEELSISNRLLQEKNKELDDFIYKSAHDLRGPIARFKGLSHLINMEYRNGDDITDHLIHLQQSADQMDTMLTRLSNVYEITARPISRQKVTIDDILDTVFTRLKYEEPYSHLDIEVNSEVKDHILIDPSLAHLILKNLIANSIRFYDPLKLKKWVKIDIRVVDDYLKIQVADNGIGIKHEQQQKIFDLFFVGSELPKGPGLGLYICKLVTKKLNGSIILNYSNAEKETMFEANIPLGKELF